MTLICCHPSSLVILDCFTLHRQVFQGQLKKEGRKGRREEEGGGREGRKESFRGDPPLDLNESLHQNAVMG